MNPTPPFICGTLLVAMIAAGISHYWSVETFVADYPTVPAVRMLPVNTPIGESKKQQLTQTKPLLTSLPDSNEVPAQQEFFNSLVSELKKLKNENRDLRDLMGETNRDVMKLAFRVDTHSESFRPLPASEEREDTSFGFDDDSFPGVLPPKASPVYPLDE